VAEGVSGLSKCRVRKATAGNADEGGQGGDMPEESGATVPAKEALLLLIVFLVMKRVQAELASAIEYGLPGEIRRDAKRATGAAPAVRAVAHAKHGRLTGDKE